MVSSRAIIEPEVDQRKVKSESKKVERALSEAEQLEPTMDTRGLQRQIDSIEGPSFEADGTGFGRAGRRSRGRAGAGGLMSGLGTRGGAASLASKALPVALAGGVGFGIFKALSAASPALQQTATMFGQAMKLFFRPFGDFLSAKFRPMASGMIDMATTFNDIANEQGLAVAVGAISREAANTLADALLERPEEPGAGSSLGPGSFRFPGLGPNLIDRAIEGFLRGAGFPGVADALEEFRKGMEDSNVVMAGFSSNAGDASGILSGIKDNWPGWGDITSTIQDTFNWPNLPTFNWPSIPTFEWPDIQFGTWNLPGLDWGKYVPDLSFNISLPDWLTGGISQSGTGGTSRGGGTAIRVPETVGGGRRGGPREAKGNPFESGTALQAGGIVTGPTRALVGEAGREAVLPLDRFFSELKAVMRDDGRGRDLTRDVVRGIEDLQRENKRTRRAVQDLKAVLRDLDGSGSRTIAR